MHPTGNLCGGNQAEWKDTRHNPLYCLSCRSKWKHEANIGWAGLQAFLGAWAVFYCLWFWQWSIFSGMRTTRIWHEIRFSCHLPWLRHLPFFPWCMKVRWPMFQWRSTVRAFWWDMALVSFSSPNDWQPFNGRTSQAGQMVVFQKLHAAWSFAIDCTMFSKFCNSWSRCGFSAQSHLKILACAAV